MREKRGRLQVERHNTDQFLKDMSCLGISLCDEQVEKFLIYYEMLIEWNEKINLTAIKNYEDVMKKHFVDSLSLVKVCDLTGSLSLIDVGTGAGFPGLALKIAFPDMKVTLLDSLGKRIHFLDEVILKLGIQGVNTVHGRAEDYAKQGKFRESFDLCVSRAVANLSTLAEYCLPFVKVDGLFISYKSEKVSEELENAGHAISILGGKVESQVEITLPDSDIYRNLVMIRKTHNTSLKYPRKAGLPTRSPL